MARPLVSYLCVTHGRSEWLPWLGRQMARQTLEDLELVVIDSTPDAAERHHATLREHLGDRVSYLHVPDNSVPAKYRLAHDRARGVFVGLVGDDDWQHPQRTEWSATALQRSRADWVGYLGGAFVHMVHDKVSVHDSPIPPASTMLVRRDVSSGIAFKANIASDTEWSFEIMRNRVGMQFPVSKTVMSLWMRHLGNLTSARGAPRAAHFGFDTTLADYIKEAGLPWDEDDQREYDALRIPQIEKLDSGNFVA